MDINQFAVYQLKNGPETRQMRFRSYEKLQQSGIQVRYEYYREVYLGKMQRQDTPENIRERLQKKIPKSFDGHSLSVSDVLVLNREGEITAYYVEKEGFTVIAGFIRIGSSGALLTFETTNFHIEGKAGSWLVLDTLIIDGREFFSLPVFGAALPIPMSWSFSEAYCSVCRQSYCSFARWSARQLSDSFPVAKTPTRPYSRSCLHSGRCPARSDEAPPRRKRKGCVP